MEAKERSVNSANRWFTDKRIYIDTDINSICDSICRKLIWIEDDNFILEAVILYEVLIRFARWWHDSWIYLTNQIATTYIESSPHWGDDSIYVVVILSSICEIVIWFVLRSFDSWSGYSIHDCGGTARKMAIRFASREVLIQFMKW